MNENKTNSINYIIDTYVNNAKRELEERWNAWKIDLNQSECHEVIGALLSRQVVLAVQLAEHPSIWNLHIAPLLIRAMADVYITISWILDDPVDRSRKFLYFGLGQEKLFLEHRKAMFEQVNIPPDEKSSMDASEAWINMQRYTFLTEVNIGSWSGISTRSMADKSGCLDFYNNVYNPLSACTHSMWHHIGKFNVTECGNPLHQYHKVPHLSELPIDINLLFHAAEILENTFKLFDTKVGIAISLPSSFSLLSDGFSNISSSESNLETSSDKYLSLYEDAFNILDGDNDMKLKTRTTSPMNAILGLSRIFICCHKAVKALYKARIGVEAMILLRTQLESLLCLLHLFEMKGNIDELEAFAEDYFDWACVKAKQNMENSYDMIPKEIRHVFYPVDEHKYFTERYNEIDEARKKDFAKKNSFLNWDIRKQLGEKHGIDWIVNFVYSESSASIHAVYFHEGIEEYVDEDGRLVTGIRFCDADEKRANGPFLMSNILFLKYLLQICLFFDLYEIMEELREKKEE